MNTRTLAILLFAAAPLASPAVANPVDNYSAAMLTKLDYTNAIAPLEAVVAEDRSDVAALLNLALAYRRSGRSVEAQTLYRRVLSLDDAVLDTADGGLVSAHVMARAAIVPEVRTATR